MSALYLVVAILGLLVAALGGAGLVAARRLALNLRTDPYHREGDALAAYMPGCSGVVLAAGLLAAAAGGWLWLRPPG